MHVYTVPYINMYASIRVYACVYVRDVSTRSNAHMCTCLLVCIHAEEGMHLGMHVYTVPYINMYICTHSHLHACICIHMYSYTYVYTYTRVYLYIRIHAHLHACIYAYTHVYVYTSIPMYTYIRMYKNIRVNTFTCIYRRPKVSW